MVTGSEYKFRGYDLTVAVDIGTASIRCAYAVRNNPGEIIQFKWSHSEMNRTEEHNMPTLILTKPGAKGEFVAIGYEAETLYLDCEDATDYEMYRDFKMALYRAKELDKEKTMAISSNGTKRPVFDLYVMILTEIRNQYAKESLIYHETLIFEDNTRWVLCIPATWHNVAKSFIRETAFEAKLISDQRSDQLIIMTEATAACLYCQTPGSRWSAQHLREDENPFPVGTKFLIIDAGARNVDFTVQKTVENESIKELVSCGGDYGGRHVDKKLEEIFAEALGGDTLKKYKNRFPKHWYDFLIAFEDAKTKMDVYSQKSLRLGVPKLLEKYMRKEEGKDFAEVLNLRSLEHGLREKDENLMISYYTQLELFKFPIDEIIKETKQMLEKPELKDLQHICMVGGFSSSELLQARMRNEFLTSGSSAKPYRFAVPDKSRFAVVVGAVMYGLKPRRVQFLFNKTYGVGVSDEFNPLKHDTKRKEIIDGMEYCTDIFRPFAQKNDCINIGTEYDMVCYPLRPNQTRAHFSFHSIDRPTKADEVIYTDSPECEEHGHFAVERPDTTGGTKRKILLEFKFENEIRIRATDKTSGSTQQLTLDFDKDT